MSEPQIDLDDLDDMIGDDGEDTPTKKASPIKAILSSLGIAGLLAAVSAGIIFMSPFGNDGGACEADGSVMAQHEKKTRSYEDVEFVNLETLVVSLGPNAQAQYLKISVSVETTKDQLEAVKHLEPRFRDVLNSYLRAVDEKDLVEPFAMTRLRAQMLRRMQTVASSEIVLDVLITDFVLN
ncbi:MAG: flagellar basal body-associated FliL family protein [Alphaproteobacteria bacterium]|nr:flagellar basal body-associated FliL family protein [Alphaproteobacteria bacterium]